MRSDIHSFLSSSEPRPLANVFLDLQNTSHQQRPAKLTQKLDQLAFTNWNNHLQKTHTSRSSQLVFPKRHIIDKENQYFQAPEDRETV